jgi:glycerophosphoryl diester phosphodiesterase
VSVWATSPLVVGHRGGRGEGWPAENTLEAFEMAHAQGARAIELDVRACADGAAIVFHDETLARMTSGRRDDRVRDLRWGELRGIDLGRGARAPSLAEALAWARDRDVAVNVELKHDVPDRLALARAAASAILARGADVLLSSFDPLLLAMVGAAAPRIPRALLVHAGQPLWASALQEAARPWLARSLHLEHAQAAPRRIARYLRRGLRLGVWTVNEPRDAAELVREGVATIITDAPGAVLGALVTRT